MNEEEGQEKEGQRWRKDRREEEWRRDGGGERMEEEKGRRRTDFADLLQNVEYVTIFSGSLFDV